MALITGLGLFIVSVLIAALSRTVAEEIEAWTPSIIRSLIKLAVGWLPEPDRERFDEEWQSHVSEVPGNVGKLVVGVGFLFAAHKMVSTGLRNHVREALSRKAAQVEELRSSVTLLVQVIQDDETLREKVLPSLNSLSSKVGEMKAPSKRKAAIIAAAFGAPVVGDMLSTIYGRAILLNERRTAVVIEMCTKVAQILKDL